MKTIDGIAAVRAHVRGTIQGVGFRPFIYRLAREHDLSGWVRNDGKGVEMHLEGEVAQLGRFIDEIAVKAPPAATVARVHSEPSEAQGWDGFRIIESGRSRPPTVRISPDLPICDTCLQEMRDTSDRRFGYSYINCTNCGPRFSIIHALPYDRSSTTMSEWRMCRECADEYESAEDRRFHAQPTACPACGPVYRLVVPDQTEIGRTKDAVTRAAGRLLAGDILAVKGIGGYHLACDASNAAAVSRLRRRKFRKEKPFAVMVRDLEIAGGLVVLDGETRSLLQAAERPIVVLKGRRTIEGVAPGSDRIGVMLPYAPLHHQLFEAGAPPILVMTSANRSSEPIAYKDEDAFERLSEIADVFLAGERPIARRVDDSVVQAGPLGPTVVRRSRGYAPTPAAALPTESPILAVGADLKNAFTLVVGGEAFVSQHIGDLAHYGALEAFRETVEDMLAMYAVPRDELVVAHDAHPDYRSTSEALELGASRVSVQHHHAHIASVLAELGSLHEEVVGIALDGTGYGLDGTIWGGEIFVGSVAAGFTRTAHLREARLAGGDAAARHPVQAAAGFLDDLESLPDLSAPPFNFPDRYESARKLLEADVRVFRTTSMGRLFDAAAALAGFTRAITYEGQAAIWLEHMAERSKTTNGYPFSGLDFRPLLQAVVDDRTRGRPTEYIARAFHNGLAEGLADVALRSCEAQASRTVILSGGVIQNQLLLGRISEIIGERTAGEVEIRVNRVVPCNDGGISLGQAAIVACRG